MIAVQCDYFGWEFMQDVEQKQLAPMINRYIMRLEPLPDAVELVLPVPLSENLYNFNDMGPVQAMDLLNSLRFVSGLFPGQFNKHKIVAYGGSHGAYLAYLCNAFMPQVFTSIIDMSAMTFPVYLLGTGLRRILTYNLTLNGKTNLTLKAYFDYLAKKILYDRDIYDLKHWYKPSSSFETKVVSFHGAGDIMVPMAEKSQLLSSLKNAVWVIVDKNKIDNKIFSSDDHGCGADFLELFDYVFKNYDLTVEREGCIFENRDFETEKFMYHIKEQGDMLRLSCEVKEL